MSARPVPAAATPQAELEAAIAAVQRTWDSDLDVVARFPSPAFRLPPPDLVGGALMPAEVRRVCDWAWAAPGFRAGDVCVRRYRDVYVAGQGLAIRPFDRAVYEATVSQHTPLDLWRGVHAVAEAEAQGGAPALDGSAVLCAKPGGDNYGHWLVEMLPRADFARRAGVAPDRVLVPSAEPALAAVMRDSLELLGFAPDAVTPVDDPVRVGRLFGVNGLTHHGTFMSPQALRPLERIKAELEPDPPARLYVTRRGHRRRFADEDGVCEAFARQGYRVVDPGGMDFRAQVRAFMGAREVVGGMGAALSNLAFAPPRIPVTVFAPGGMADTFFWFIAGLRRQRYREVRCEVSPEPAELDARHRDLLLDPARAVALATEWAGRAA